MLLYKIKEYVIAVVVVETKNSENIVDKLDEINREISPDECQFFNPDNIMGRDHIEAAIVNGILSFNSPTRAAKTLRMEILLKLAATDQIKEAIKRIGINKNSKEIGIIVISKDENKVKESIKRILQHLGEAAEKELAERDDVDRLARVFGISDKELKAIQAGSRAEAFKMALFHRMATARL